VLDPLGMNMTGTAAAGDPAEWMTQGYDGDVVPHWSSPEAIMGAGGIRSNAEDMLKYLKANVGPPETALAQAMRMAQEVRVPQGGDGTGYGFSWSTVAVAGEPPILTHGGGTGGYSTLIAFDPEKRIGTVLLANTRTLSDRLGRDLLYPDPPPPEWQSQVDAGVLAQYAGRYETSSGTTKYYVRLEDDGHLTYQPTGQVRARLYSKSDGSFYLLRGPWSFTFEKDESGKVVRLLMEIDEREPSQAGLTRSAVKVADETPRSDVVAGNAGFSLAFRRLVRRSAFAVYTSGPQLWIPMGLAGLLVLAMLVRRGVRLIGTRRS